MMKKTLAMVCAGVMSAAPMVASAYEAGDMLVRFGAVNVAPDDGGDPDGVYVDDNTQVGVSFTYMMTNNVGVEVLAATPFTHDVKLKSSDATIGETKHLPPTVIVQYYFNTGSQVTPYVGAGLNHTVFFDEKYKSGGEFELKDSTGLALQAGIDYKIDDQWALNAAIWKVDIDTEITSTANKGVEVEIDPMVYMVGAAYKF